MIGRVKWWLAVVGIAVGFGASAAATADYASQLGVHPHLAVVLPAVLELMIVVAALDRVDPDTDTDVATHAVYWSGIAVAWAINFAHAGGGAAGAIAAIPTLALPAGMHIALHGRRVDSAECVDGTPAAVESTPAPAAAVNGHTPQRADLVLAVPDADVLAGLRERHGTLTAVAESLGVSRDQLNHHRRKIGDL